MASDKLLKTTIGHNDVAWEPIDRTLWHITYYIDHPVYNIYKDTFYTEKWIDKYVAVDPTGYWEGSFAAGSTTPFTDYIKLWGSGDSRCAIKYVSLAPSMWQDRLSHYEDAYYIQLDKNSENKEIGVYAGLYKYMATSSSGVEKKRMFKRYIYLKDDFDVVIRDVDADTDGGMRRAIWNYTVDTDFVKEGESKKIYTGTISYIDVWTHVQYTGSHTVTTARDIGDVRVYDVDKDSFDYQVAGALFFDQGPDILPRFIPMGTLFSQQTMMTDLARQSEVSSLDGTRGMVTLKFEPTDEAPFNILYYYRTISADKKWWFCGFNRVISGDKAFGFNAFEETPTITQSLSVMAEDFPYTETFKGEYCDYVALFEGDSANSTCKIWRKQDYEAGLDNCVTVVSPESDTYYTLQGSDWGYALNIHAYLMNWPKKEATYHCWRLTLTEGTADTDTDTSTNEGQADTDNDTDTDDDIE